MAIPLRSRRSLRNPLIRRVQRHTDLATLFRSPQETFSGAGTQPSGLMPGRFAESLAPEQQTSEVPLVRATLVPVSSEPEAAEPIAPAGPVERADQAAQIQPVDTQEPGEAAPVTDTIQRSTPPSTPTMQRRSEKTAHPSREERRQPEAQPTPTPAETSGSEGEERVWNRLQAIFRKHQEKEARETTTEVEDTAQALEPAEAAAQTQPEEQPAVIEDETSRVDAEPGVTETSTRLVMQDEAAAPVQRPAETTSEAEPGGESRAQAIPMQQRPAPPSLEEVVESDHPIEGVEKEAGEGEEAEAAESVDATDVQTEREEADLDEILVDEVQVVKPSYVQRDEAPRTPTEGKPEPGSQTEAQQAVQPAEPEESEGAETSADQEPPNMSLRDKPASTAADQTVISEARLTGGTAAAGIPTQRTPEEPAGQPADLFAAPETRGMDRPQDIRSLPLEEAWPVQRLAEEPRPQAELPQPAPSSELARSAEAHQVSSLLQGVTPGQPTDSQVEVVTPRRPRPTPAVQTRRLEQPAETTQEEQAVESTAPSATLKRESAAFEQAEAPLADAASATAETPETPSLVPTEIGALPVDLWQLIGQEPPQASPSADRPATAIQRQTEAGPETAPSTGSAAVQEKKAGEPIFTYQARPGIQREEAVGATASEAAAPEEQGSDEAGGEEEEPNLDELSRRVYQEVKRRLAHEWERMRRRL